MPDLQAHFCSSANKGNNPILLSWVLWVCVTQVGCDAEGISPSVLCCSSWLYLVVGMRPGSLSLCVTDGPVPIRKCDHIYPEVWLCVCVWERERKIQTKQGQSKKCSHNDEDCSFCDMQVTAENSKPPAVVSAFFAHVIRSSQPSVVNSGLLLTHTLSVDKLVVCMSCSCTDIWYVFIWNREGNLMGSGTEALDGGR